MGKCAVLYQLIFFDVRDPEVTEAYVFVEAQGDCPIHLQGWHHKSFPARVKTIDILQQVQDCVLWPLEAPPFRMLRDDEQ